MGGYVSLPEPIANDAAQASANLTRALDHVAQLPAKAKRKAG